MPALPLQTVQQAISSAGFSWIARDTTISRLARNTTPGSLFGLAISEPDLRSLMAEGVRETSAFSAVVQAPPQIDWRNNGGNFVTSIKYQRTCGACVSFATCAALESRMIIAGNISEADFDLSEAHLFSCGGAKCATGWNFEPALQQAKATGVGLEKDFPYTGQDQACRSIPPAVKVTSWNKVTAMNARKQAIAVNGPVIAGMRVFSDFYQYGGGIYKHATGNFEGLHAVAVVGYSDKEGCWIVKNSWDRDWGEQGFFRMAYGECGIDTEFPFFDPMVVKVPSPTA